MGWFDWKWAQGKLPGPGNFHIMTWWWFHGNRHLFKATKLYIQPICTFLQVYHIPIYFFFSFFKSEAFGCNVNAMIFGSLGHKLWVTESRLLTVFPDEELVKWLWRSFPSLGESFCLLWSWLCQVNFWFPHIILWPTLACQSESLETSLRVPDGNT